MELHEGASIDGKYDLKRLLGRGGQAQVWEATQLGLGGFAKKVVLKLVSPEAENKDQIKQAFLWEAQLAAQLRHPHIIEIYDVGEFGPLVYIAMEHVAGSDLHRLLNISRKTRKKALPWTIAAKLILEVCKGLHYAHTRKNAEGNPLNLVHRDLKPGNILLSEEGYVKIIDFGIAKAQDSLHQTAAGMLKGTPVFMSPEQVRSQPLDARSDLFSLGSVFFALCVGEPPFLGDDLFGTLFSIVNDPPPPIRRLVPDLPEDVEMFLTKLLAKERHERFQDARTVQQALDGILRIHNVYLDLEELGQFYRDLNKDTSENASWTGLPASDDFPLQSPPPAAPPPGPSKNTSSQVVLNDLNPQTPSNLFLESGAFSQGQPLSPYNRAKIIPQGQQEYFGEEFTDGETAFATEDSDEFADGSTEFADGPTEFADGATEFGDGATEFGDGATMIATDSSDDFSDGATEFVSHGPVTPNSKTLDNPALGSNPDKDDDATVLSDDYLIKHRPKDKDDDATVLSDDYLTKHRPKDKDDDATLLSDDYFAKHRPDDFSDGATEFAPPSTNELIAFTQLRSSLNKQSQHRSDSIRKDELARQWAASNKSPFWKSKVFLFSFTGVVLGLLFGLLFFLKVF